MNYQNVITQAIYRILTQLARVGLRYGVSANAMTELVRRAYVNAAEISLKEQGKKPLTSRLCATTGLYRKEIVRIKELPPVGYSEYDDRYNRSTRVISGWVRDSNFCTSTGQPSVLKIEGKASFSELVKRYSGDMTPKAMLEELVRLGVAEVSGRDTVKLKSKAYIPQNDEMDIVQILGMDTADLIDTIHYNISSDAPNRRFQRKVMYVHIPQRHIEQFKKYATAESQALLEKLDIWLSERDTEEQSKGTPGARLGLGIYLVESENTIDESHMAITHE